MLRSLRCLPPVAECPRAGRLGLERLKTRRAEIRNLGRALFIVLLVASGCGTEPAATNPGEGPAGDDRKPAVALADVDWGSLDTAVAQAIRDAERLVVAKPGSADRWGRLGMLLLAHDLFAPAGNCFATAESLNSSEPRWPYFEGIALRQLNPVAAASKLRIAAEQYGPRVVPPQLRLAELLIELERLDEAESLLMRVLQSNADQPDARMVLAQIDLLRDRPQACLDRLGEALRSDTPNRKALQLASEASRRLGDFAAADRLREQAQRRPDTRWADPIYADIVAMQIGLRSKLARADELFLQNRVDDSIRLMEQVCLDYPDSEWARILLARGLIRARRLERGRSPPARGTSVELAIV